MKIGVIVPTRGDRLRLLDNCRRMIASQTLQPNHVLFQDYFPQSDQCDITQRYRTGYNFFRGKGYDAILFMEDDDWYSTIFIETMISEWTALGKPNLFGINYSIYYHIQKFAYFKMIHYQRSAGMCTLIRPDLEIKWCPDSYAYLDSYLWMASGIKSKALIAPDKLICMGIKHGTGKNGGEHHNTKMERFKFSDSNKAFLSSHLDRDSFDFYSKYFDN